MKGIKSIMPTLLAALLAVTLLAGCSCESEWDRESSVSSDVVVAQTQNYTLSESELRVLEYQCFNEVYTSLYYNALYYSYGISAYVDNDYLFPDISTYVGNPFGYVEAHIDDCDVEGKAYELAETLLVYNEGADREGYTADDDRLTEAKKNVAYIAMDTLRLGAENADMTLSAYIRSTMGNGVSESDVENVIDLCARAGLFAEDKAESLQEAVSLAEAEEYREEHKDQFYYAEYVSCELPDEDWVTAEVRTLAAACQTLNELQALLDAARPDDDADDEMREGERPIGTVDGYTASNGYTASQVIKITPSEGMTVVDQNGSSYVIEYFGDFDHQAIGAGEPDYRVFFEGETIIVDRSDSIASSSTQIYVHPSSNLFTNSFLDMAIDAFHQYIMRKNGVSDDDRTASSLTGGQSVLTWNSGSTGDYTVNWSSEIITDSSGSSNPEANNNGVLQESGKQTRYLPATDDDTDDDLTRWLFAAGRQAGDVTVLKIGSTYCWLCIPEDATVNGYDTELTKVGYYVQLKDDAADQDTAGEQVYTKEDKYALIKAAYDLSDRRDVFESILRTSEHAAITEDSLQNIGDELAEWFYSDDRREGDYACITVGEGADAREYAVLFIRENEETWLRNAKYCKAEEKLPDWYEAMKATCGYTADHEN